jgi:hypothetical protein
MILTSIVYFHHWVKQLQFISNISFISFLTTVHPILQKYWTLHCQVSTVIPVCLMQVRIIWIYHLMACFFVATAMTKYIYHSDKQKEQHCTWYLALKMYLHICRYCHMEEILFHFILLIQGWPYHLISSHLISSLWIKSDTSTNLVKYSHAKQHKVFFCTGFNCYSYGTWLYSMEHIRHMLFISICVLHYIKIIIIWFFTLCRIINWSCTVWNPRRLSFLSHTCC